MKKVNVREKLAMFNDHWNPRIIAELNGQCVKVAKLLGDFPWHQHEDEDELFYVIKGDLKLEFRDKVVELKAGDFLVVPRGVEHRPVAAEEVEVMLFEPNTTVNTGDLESHDLKRSALEKI